MKKLKWIKITFFKIIVILLSALFLNASKPELQFQRLKYSKVIKITKNWKKAINSISWNRDKISIDETFPLDEMNVTINILYRYSGNTFETAGGYFFTQNSSIIGNIYYFSQKGKILPEARKFLNREPDHVIGPSIVSAHGGNSKKVIYENGRLFSLSLALFSPNIFKHTDLKEAILQKKLFGILLVIEKIVINWDLTEGQGINRKEKAGQWIVKVDRALRIDIEYEK